MPLNIEPPSFGDSGISRFMKDWLDKFRRTLENYSGSIPWSDVSKVGSNLTDIETRNHADLQNLNTASYTHLTATNHTDLTDGGATTLHKHDHGGMDGLSDDDHSQYLLADGTRSLTGNWDAGNYKITTGELLVEGPSTLNGPTKVHVNQIQNSVLLTGATYDSVSKSVSAQDTNPQSVFFSPDGSKMFMLGATGDDFNSYTLSTPWDVSTATYVTNYAWTPAGITEGTPTGCFFRSDGLKFFLVGQQSYDVYRFSMSTAWDLSTASYDLDSISVGGEETLPTGVHFSHDGTKMYIIGTSNDNVVQYNLSTAWLLSSAVYSQSLSVSAVDATTTDLFFSRDGSLLFILGNTNDKIFKYNLSTPWDISTAVLASDTFTISQDATPHGIFFRNDLRKFYVVGTTNDTVYQYSIPQQTQDLIGSLRVDEVVLPKASGSGIKVDLRDPTFGWKDLLGAITVKGTGGGGAAANPDYVVYRGGLYGYRFGTAVPNNHMHEAFIEYHIPHDYLPGSDLYIHVHWSQITVDTGGTAGVPGVAKWYFEVSYADGHGTAGGAADPFIAPITVSVTQQGSTTQYGHMIAEVQFTNNGGTVGLIDSNTITVDGLVLVRVYRDPTDVADTLNQDTFVHFVDIHYQSTNMPTKNKAPNFYL